MRLFAGESKLDCGRLATLFRATPRGRHMCKPIDWDVFRERIRMIGLMWTTHVEIPEVPAGKK